MAARSHSTFKKRQKEIARMEKQRDKAARRMQRKLVAKGSSESATSESDATEPGELTNPPDTPSGGPGE